MSKKRMIVFTFVFLVICGLVISQDYQFKPKKASITVTIPSGAKTWYKGKDYLIKWVRTGIMHTKVKIRLYDPTGTTKIFGITDETDNNKSFVWTIPKTVNPGSYVIRVKTIDGKIGDDSNIFEIKKAPFQFKFKKPVITKVLAMAPGGGFYATPGGELHLKGNHFGSMKGTVHLYGLSKGQPSILLEISKWDGKKNMISGKLPYNITGIKDKTFQVQVKNIIGLSNKKDCGFRARRVTKVLSWNDPAVKLISKKSDANFSFTIPPIQPGNANLNMAGTIGGYHRNQGGVDGAFSGDDSGYDQFEIVLKNGWRIKDGYYVNKYLSSSSEKLSGPNPQPVCGETGGDTEWRPKFTWKVTQGDTISYFYKVEIIGPVGVPYK